MRDAGSRQKPSRQRVRAADRALAGEYGHKRWEGGSGDLIGELVATILSQNTAATNSRPAFAALRAAFPRWEDVEQAAVGDLARAIHRAGLANQRAARIKRGLADILQGLGQEPQQVSEIRIDPRQKTDLRRRARRWLGRLVGR